MTDAYEAPPMYKNLHENIKSFYNIHWASEWHTRCLGTSLGPHVARDGKRHARRRTSRAIMPRTELAVNWANAPPLLTGGHVVADSNPVSPTDI
jgi:hypothetical protein